MQKWQEKKVNDTPIANTILTLSFVHYLQLMTFYAILLKISNIINILRINKLYVFMFLLLFFVFNYLLLYNKRNWLNYLQEFENESEKASKKGNIFVIGYLIGSILLFFITVILLFSYDSIF